MLPSEPAHTARPSLAAAERLIEVTIGLWPDDDPPGQRPPRLAAAIVKALHDEGYMICVKATISESVGTVPNG